MEYDLVTTKVEECRVRAVVEGKSSLFLYCRMIAAQGFCHTDPKTQARKGSASPEAIANYLEQQYANYQKWLGTPLRGTNFWAEEFPQFGGREEFLVTLQQVRIPAGKTLLDVAKENAKQGPLEPLVRHSPTYCRFISIAGHLQRARAPGQTIQLGVEKFGRILGVDPKMVSQYRKWAVEDGILELVKKHNTAAALASEFIFHVEKFNWRTGKQRETD